MISGNDGDGIDVASGVDQHADPGQLRRHRRRPEPKSLGNGGDGYVDRAAPGTTIGGTAQGAGNVISANAQAGVSIQGAAASDAGPGQLHRHRQDRARPPWERDVRSRPEGTSRRHDRRDRGGSGTSSPANSGSGIGLSWARRGDAHPGQPDRHRRDRRESARQRDRHLRSRRAPRTTRSAAATRQPATRSPSSAASASTSTNAGTGNLIRLNAMFSNAGLGIDLGGDGVTLNDSVPHTGPNHHQNFPVITVVSARRHHNGHAAPPEHCEHHVRLDFYTLSSTNGSGFGEGRYVLGIKLACDRRVGRSHFTFTFPHPRKRRPVRHRDGHRPGRQYIGILPGVRLDITPTARIAFTTLTVNEGVPIAFNGAGSIESRQRSPDLQLDVRRRCDGDRARPNPHVPYDRNRSRQLDRQRRLRRGYRPRWPRSRWSTCRRSSPRLVHSSADIHRAPRRAAALEQPSLQSTATWRSERRQAGNAGAVDLYDGVPTDDGVSSTYVYGALIHVFADPDPTSGDHFGASLAVVGNELVVGAGQLATGYRQRRGLRLRRQSRQPDVRQPARNPHVPGPSPDDAQFGAVGRRDRHQHRGRCSGQGRRRRARSTNSRATRRSRISATC